MTLGGQAFGESGAGLNNVAVELYANNALTTTGTTRTAAHSVSTNEKGYWEFAGIADGLWRIKILYRDGYKEISGLTQAQFYSLYVGANTFSVSNAGNVLIGGTLGVTGAASFTGNIAWKSGTAFTITLDHTATDNRTWVFPDSSDTVVGKATTDVLTNKTLTTPTITSLATVNHVNAGTTIDVSGNRAIVINNSDQTDNNLNFITFSGADTGGTQRKGAGIGARHHGRTASTTPSDLLFLYGSGNAFVEGGILTSAGRFGLGVAAPTAVLHLKAGTATASTGPLKFTSGTNMTVAVAGNVEYNGNYYLSNTSLRFPVGGTLKDYIADVTVGGAETDIFTFTTLANTLNSDGDKIIAMYSGNFVTVGTELTQLKVYFGGTAVWDSTGIAPATGTTSWRVYAEIIRVSSTIIRYTVSLNTTGASGYVYAVSGELTGLTLSGTNIIKITGTSSGVDSGSGDIVGKSGYITFSPAA